MYIEYSLFALTGMLAGTVAGLLGLGGGIVVVPALAFIFAHYGSNPQVAMHMAAATSLAAMVFTATTSAYSHHRRGAVIWPVFWRTLPGIIIGTIFGVALASQLPTKILKIIFGIFLLFVAVRMFFIFKPKSSRKLPGFWGLSGFGLLVGGKSGLLGIGGGALTVPFLTWCNVSMRQASGISAACGLPIAITGTISTIIAGWGVTGNHYTFGYVYLPAAITVAIASMLSVFIGERLSLLLPVNVLKRVFAVFLLLTAAHLFF